MTADELLHKFVADRGRATVLRMFCHASGIHFSGDTGVHACPGPILFGETPSTNVMGFSSPDTDKHVIVVTDLAYT